MFTIPKSITHSAKSLMQLLLCAVCKPQNLGEHLLLNTLLRHRIKRDNELQTQPTKRKTPVNPSFAYSITVL